MSGRHFKFLILTITLVLLTSVYINAQSNTTQAPEVTSEIDTLFSEIILTEDGVSAVDIDGNDWYFDFENDMFIPGLLERSAVSQQSYEEFEPVETRCTIEKKVKLKTSKVVVIDVDEFVDGDIRVFGRVTVKGWVKGSVTSFNNRVIVKSTGQVDGNISASKIVINDGGVVTGTINENSLELPDFPTELPSNGFEVIMIIMATLCIFIFLIIALLPKKLEVISDCFNTYKLRSTMLGILFLFLMLPIMALIAITIIGVVVVVFVPLGYVLAAIIGIAAFSHTIGTLVFGKFLSPGTKLYMKTFLGFSLFAMIWIIGITGMTDTQDTEMNGIGIFFFIVSIIFSIVPFFGGIGASVLTRFGTRSYMSWKDKTAEYPQSSTPAPPPMPKAPEIRTPQPFTPATPPIPKAPEIKTDPKNSDNS